MQILILNIVLISILFYLIGSIPSAYLIARTKDIDITKSGSGNVGALNSYEVTKSKTVGVLVLIIDLLKGFIPALVLTRILKTPMSFCVIPLLMLVVGHNFSVWLKFKGGRGLATTAGISLTVNFWLLIFWSVLFILTFAIKRNVHIGNLVATVLLPLTIIFSSDFIMKFNYDYSFVNSAPTVDIGMLFTFTSSVCILILIKHINPIIELIKQNNKI